MRKIVTGCVLVAVLMVAVFFGWTRIKASLPKSDCTHDCCDNHSCTAAEREVLKNKRTGKGL